MVDKEATVFVIDVSHTMEQQAPGVSSTLLEWCLEYVWDKLGIKIMAARKTDYVAVIVVGSLRTDNALGYEDDYRHIRVVLPFPSRDGDALKSYTFTKSHSDIIKAEVRTCNCTEGDLLSAIIIGIQMITDFCTTLKFKKNLIVLTNGELMSDYTDAEPVVDQLKGQGITLSVLGVGFDDPDFGYKEESKSNIKANNEKSLRKICTDSDGVYATFAEVSQSLAIPRIKPVNPVASFKGYLSIGDSEKFPNTIYISVERFPKTKQAKVPSATKVSIAAETRSVIAEASQHGSAARSSEAASLRHQVLSSRTYKLPDGQEVEDRSQLEKGYSYGKTIVPITKADEDFLQFESTPGLRILGFLDSASHTRYLSLGESSLIVAQKANNSAALALSSLIHALYETETYALARLVRKDNVSPVMVLLAPNIEADFESLLEVVLPFAEDVRQYKFATLDRIKTPKGDILEQHRYLPSVKLVQTMGQLLDSMDLDSHDSEGDQLEPENTYNYGIHRMFQVIQAKAFHQCSATIPKAPDILLRNSRIPERTITSPGFDSCVKQLAMTADTKVVPVRTANKRNRKETHEAVKTDIDLEALLNAGDDVSATKESDQSDQKSTGQMHAIGHIQPLRDFEFMIKNGDIRAAFDQLQPVVEELIQYSLGNQTYGMALECLRSFRKHAQEQDETPLFEQYVARLRTKFQDDRVDFLALLDQEDI